MVNLNFSSEPLLARIVFVRNEKQKDQWLALLSTDLSLTEEEIIALYGKRWDGCLLQNDQILLKTHSGIPSSIL